MYFSQSKGDHPEDGIMICILANQREIIPDKGIVICTLVNQREIIPRMG